MIILEACPLLGKERIKDIVNRDAVAHLAINAHRALLHQCSPLLAADIRRAMSGPPLFSLSVFR